MIAARPPPLGDAGPARIQSAAWRPTVPRSLPHIREFTPRSIGVGLVVALIIGASYPYMVLKFGFGPNISVVSAFFGFVALGLFSKSYNRWENNVVQTAGTVGRADRVSLLAAGRLRHVGRRAGQRLQSCT